MGVKKTGRAGVKRAEGVTDGQQNRHAAAPFPPVGMGVYMMVYTMVSGILWSDSRPFCYLGVISDLSSFKPIQSLYNFYKYRVILTDHEDFFCAFLQIVLLLTDYRQTHARDP